MGIVTVATAGFGEGLDRVPTEAGVAVCPPQATAKRQPNINQVSHRRPLLPMGEL
jgi:hypothetical protein